MKKQEWREKLIKSKFSTGSEGSDRLEECSMDDIANFFYSLHLQEIEKIRGMIKPLVERVRLDVDVIICDCGEKYKDSDLDLSVGDLEKAIDDILLAITDEKKYEH